MPDKDLALARNSATAIVISRDSDQYLCGSAEKAKARFLAIDSVSGRTIGTDFHDESRRTALDAIAQGTKR